MMDTPALEQALESATGQQEQLHLLVQHLPALVEGYHPDATRWLDHAMNLSRELHAYGELAEFLCLRGIQLIYQASNLQAYGCLMEAFQHAREQNLPRLLARLYMWLGNVCTGMGHFHEALSWFEEGLQHTRAHDLKLEHLRIQGCMCWLYRHNNEPRLTVEYADGVIAEALRQGLKNELAYVHANVVEAHLDLHAETPSDHHLSQAELGLEHFRAILQTRPTERLYRFELYLQTKVQIGQGDLEGAEASLHALLGRLGQDTADTLYGDSHLDFAVIRGKQGRWEDALHHLRLSRQNFEQASAQYGVMLTLQQEASLLEQKGNFREALTAFKRFHAAYEQQQRQQAREKTQMMQIKLHVEKIHQELMQLRDASQKLEQQNALLHEQTLTLSQEAKTDTLTGLPNRRAFNERFARMLHEAQLQQTGVGVVVMDIDHFKGINDRYTHEVGDLVLQQVARLLEQHCRGQDFVARWGGEEFVALLPGLDAGRCHQVCERLRLAVQNHDWADLTPGRQITISLGYALGTSPAGLDTLLKEADQQLYEAKHAGRNTVRPEPHLSPSDLLTLV